MVNFVSPGNYVLLKEFDSYLPSLNSTIVGVVGFASRGPVDEPTLVTNQESLVKTFGTPNRATGGQGLFGAYKILDRTNSLYFIRAAAPSKASAVTNIQLGAQAAVAVSSVDASNAYAFLINVVDSSGTAFNSEPYIVGVASSTDPIGAIADTVAAYLPAAAGFDFIKVTSSVGYFVGNFAGASSTLAVSSILESTNGIFSALGTAGIAAGGGGGVLEGPNGVISTPTGAALIAEAGTWYAASAHKVFGTPGVHYTDLTLYDTAFATAWLAGSGVAAGYTASALTSYGNTFLSANTSGGAINLTTLYPGAGYNYATSSTANGLATYGVRAVVSARRGKAAIIEIEVDGGAEENYLVDYVDTLDNSTNWLLDSLNTRIATNNPTSRYYYARLGSITAAGAFSASSNAGAPNAYSATFVAAATHSSNGLATSAVNVTMIFGKPLASIYSFAGGANGDVADEGNVLTDADITNALIGSTASRTGMQGFLDESVDISIMTIPGIHTQAVQNAAVTLGESTANFLYVTSPPEGLPSAQRAVNWVNGLGDGRTAAINNKYCAIYWPWLEDFDNFNSVTDYIDPAVYAVRQMLFTEQVAETWTAPAGMVRGRLTGPTNVEVVVDQGSRDLLYTNNINPIAKFASEGIVVWGQKTTQRATTSTDRVNVLRMLVYIKKVLLRGTKQFAFEPNDPITWNRIITSIKPFLQDIKDRRGVRNFQVICNETTNTAARIDRGEVWCQIIIEAVKAGEIIVFDLNVTNQTGTVSLAT